MTIQELYKIIEERRASDSDSSYTSSLFRDGLDRIAQKVGEEAVEVVIAAKNDDRSDFIGEVADLTYHMLVLLVDKGVTVESIGQKLQQRHALKEK